MENKAKMKINKDEQEKIKNEILEFGETFTDNFEREYKEENFFITNLKSSLNNVRGLEQIWDIEIDEPKKLKTVNDTKLFDILNKVFTYYNYLLETFNYESQNRTEFNTMINKIFLILCNIYDLFPNFLEIFFKNDWLKLHLKLIDACLDVKNLPEPGLGSYGKEKINTLSILLTFFCLCMSKDKDLNNRIYLLMKYPDLFYKIAIIAANTNYSCCCGHGMNYNLNSFAPSIKSIFLVFETFNYMENNNINYEPAKKAKFQILEFFFKNIGKNICIVYLYKMAKMCNVNEIFNHLLNTTNLFKEALTNKEKDYSFEHAIDIFEEFVSLCKNPDHIVKILEIISPPKKGLKSRIYREILKNLTSVISDNQIEYLEKSIYNGVIFQKVLETLKQDVYLGEYEGIFQILLDSNNNNIVKIFYKNKYEVGIIMMNQVKNLINNKLIGIRLNSAIKIINLFLKIGNKVKEKYNTENYYIEQFRDIYKIISNLIINYDEEDKEEFLNYYKDK